MTATTYRFGSFELQPDQRRLLEDGRPVTLGARAFDVLLALVERAEQLVTKQQLLDLAWPGLIVEENNLQVQIGTLRKLLGPQAIATIPGRGYRLALAVEAELPLGAKPEAVASTPARASAAPVPSVDALPALYGRSEDLAALSDLLRQHALVTVVGPAGIGKTRLAQAVVHELRSEFADGAQFVELASLTDPDLVATTIARALGMPAGDPQAALALTVQALAGQRLLLVLDNCEHLLDAVDRVVAGLRKGAPTVRILATSQELLRHPDEHVYRLSTLALPAEVSAHQAREAGAVQLFVARVQAVDTRFQLTEGNVGAAVDICRRLDGIPLAIELAAARVPLLGVDGVRDRLDERFRLLTAGSRLALRRHQTLHAALEWSYALLSSSEQTVLDRLGVFAGGFTLESAQQLASDEAIDAWAVLDHLGALVDKSLVIADGGPVPRYRMLETTRAFALARLAARGATLPALRRHAEVTLTLFERFYRDNLAGVPPGPEVVRLGVEIDNFRSAMHWASGAEGDRHIAIALIGAAGAGTRGFLANAGLLWEGSQWCQSLKPLVDDSIPVREAARFWHACAEQGQAGNVETWIEDAKRSVALYREAEDKLGQFLGWIALAFALSSTNRPDEVRSAIGKAKALRDATWPPRARAMFENVVGLCFVSIDEPRRAREHFVAYLNLCRQMGSETDTYTATGNLAELDVAAGYAERAVATMREPIARFRALATRYDDGLGFRNYATALLEAGQLQEAEAAFREALPLVRRAFGTYAYVLNDAASLLARRGQFADAAKVAAYAESAYAARGGRLRPVACMLREKLFALLGAHLSVEALERLGNEGRALTDEQACLVAFPPTDP